MKLCHHRSDVDGVGLGWQWGKTLQTGEIDINKNIQWMNVS